MDFGVEMDPNTLQKGSQPKVVIPRFGSLDPPKRPRTHPDHNFTEKRTPRESICHKKSFQETTF